MTFLPSIPPGRKYADGRLPIARVENSDSDSLDLVNICAEREVDTHRSCMPRKWLSHQRERHPAVKLVLWKVTLATTLWNHLRIFILPLYAYKMEQNGTA
jgi:hypothetical protein